MAYVIIAAKTILKRGGSGRYYAAYEKRIEEEGGEYVLYTGGRDPLYVKDLETAMRIFDRQ